MEIYYSLRPFVVEAFLFATGFKKLCCELSEGGIKYERKKVEVWRKNKVRENKVTEKIYVNFYLKWKWLHYYGMY